MIINDTATAVAKGPLSLDRYATAGAGNKDFGYIGGGKSPISMYSTVDRIDYSNDTPTTPTKGPLTVARYGLAATSAGSNALPTDNGITSLFNFGSDTRDNMVPQGTDFGYFGGGEPGPSTKSTVDRIDYSNDTATAVAKGPLTLARRHLGAFGSGVWLLCWWTNWSSNCWSFNNRPY